MTVLSRCTFRFYCNIRVQTYSSFLQINTAHKQDHHRANHPLCKLNLSTCNRFTSETRWDNPELVGRGVSTGQLPCRVGVGQHAYIGLPYVRHASTVRTSCHPASAGSTVDEHGAAVRPRSRCAPQHHPANQLDPEHYGDCRRMGEALRQKAEERLLAPHENQGGEARGGTPEIAVSNLSSAHGDLLTAN